MRHGLKPQDLYNLISMKCVIKDEIMEGKEIEIICTQNERLVKRVSRWLLVCLCSSNEGMQRQSTSNRHG